MTANPLLYVKSGPGDYSRPNRAGGSTKFFDENYSEHLREVLRTSVASISTSYASGFEKYGNVPGVIKVSLFEDAMAKSHRPHALFYKSECDLVGGVGFGEILFSVDPTSLQLLEEEIASTRTKQGFANLSTIKSIKPVTFKEKSIFQSKQSLLEAVSRDDGRLKLKLFNYRSPEDQQNTLNAFFNLCEDLGIRNTHEVIRYSAKLVIHELRIQSVDQIEQLSLFLASKNLDTYSKIDLIQPAATFVRNFSAEEIPQPVLGRDYPLVGVFDSGIHPGNTYVRNWIADSETYLTPDQNHSHNHGSFISGVIVNGRGLNHSDERFPACQSKIVDVAAFSTVEGLDEKDFKIRLENAVTKFPEVKVWNISLNTRTPCDEHQLSDLGAFLDHIQDTYDVSIVVSAGNYETRPLRAWPSNVDSGKDRVASPGDSVRALTVGSLAHVDRTNSCVKADHPSPFSRRGPGPSFLAKPDVVHYGGNCTDQGQYAQTGLLSVIGIDQVVEGIGTSYAAPIVANILANVRHKLGDGDSRLLSHALVVHSALLRSNGIDASQLRYYGFGMPTDVDEIFRCANHQATAVFDISLVHGFQFTKPFPIPACLRTTDNKVKGEFTVTLVYQSPLDPGFGAEFCRTNIDVSLGKVEEKDGKLGHKLLVPLAPRDIGELYEANQIEHGYKWSPVKVYHKVIPKGLDAENWQLRVTLNNRKDFEPTEAIRGIIIITVSDPEANKPVYDDFKREAQTMGLEISEARIEERERIR